MRSTATASPPPGLTYFWFLNGDCRLGDLRQQVAAFAEANAHAVVLHPRNGLRVPYGGKDWLKLMRTLALEPGERSIYSSWLYDEDDCPSGQGGGRLLAEHPAYEARGISRFEAKATLQVDELFVFPSGTLLWAGAIGPNVAVAL